MLLRPHVESPVESCGPYVGVGGSSAPNQPPQPTGMVWVLQNESSKVHRMTSLPFLYVNHLPVLRVIYECTLYQFMHYITNSLLNISVREVVDTYPPHF